MLSSKRENSLKILFGSALNLKIDIGNNIFPMQEIKLHLLKSLCSTKELKFFLPVGPIHFLGLFWSIFFMMRNREVWVSEGEAAHEGFRDEEFFNACLQWPHRVMGK